jgi:hypothetical protein
VRLRLRDLADLTTVLQGLAALSGATFFAVLGQAAAQAFLGLSVLERVLLGGSLFLVVLALLLSRVKAIRERQAVNESERGRLMRSAGFRASDRGILSGAPAHD